MFTALIHIRTHRNTLVEQHRYTYMYVGTYIKHTECMYVRMYVCLTSEVLVFQNTSTSSSLPCLLNAYTTVLAK